MQWVIGYFLFTGKIFFYIDIGYNIVKINSKAINKKEKEYAACLILTITNLKNLKKNYI